MAQQAQWLITSGCGDLQGNPAERVREIRDQVRARVEKLLAQLDAAR